MPFQPGHNHGSKSHAGGAPEGNSNAVSHGLYTDPEDFLERVDPDEQERIESIYEAILSRLRAQDGVVDEFDASQAQTLAVKTFIVRRAGQFAANAMKDGETREIHRTYRLYSESVLDDAKNLGLLQDPESKKADALSQWRGYIDSEVVEEEPDESLPTDEPESNELVDVKLDPPEISEQLEDYLESNEFTDEERKQLHDIEAMGEDRMRVHLLIDGRT